MTSIDYLRRNGQPNHSEQIDNINIYDLASTLNRKGNPVDSLDAVSYTHLTLPTTLQV